MPGWVPVIQVADFDYVALRNVQKIWWEVLKCNDITKYYLETEFLNVTVSPSCDGAQFYIEMCTCVLKNHALLPVLQVFFAYFYIFYVKFWVYFGDFLVQNF